MCAGDPCPPCPDEWPCAIAIPTGNKSAAKAPQLNLLNIFVLLAMRGPVIYWLKHFREPGFSSSSRLLVVRASRVPTWLEAGAALPVLKSQGLCRRVQEA